MQKSQQQFRSKSLSLFLSLFCLVTVVGIGKASAQPNTVATPNGIGENLIYNLSQMTPVKDQWSSTQSPLNLANMRAMRLSADESGQDSVSELVVNFRLGSTLVIHDYLNNNSALAILDRALQDSELLSKVDYIVIAANTSPEGNAEFNAEFSEGRALALKTYIMWKFPSLDRDMIYTFSAGENWAGLRREVENDLQVPNRSEVLALLDSSRSNDAKKAALKQIAGGSAYTYIEQHILPGLRVGTILFLSDAALESQPVVKPKKEYVVEEMPTVVEKFMTDTVYVDRIIELQPVESVKPVERVKKPLFAFKTNLLFDLGTAINVEAELPIGQRWSVAGEWIFPWWLIESEQKAMQVGIATLELRRWLGQRDTKQPLTGWFLGAHGSWGYYDLEWKDEGFQGELWYSGLSGGYAHTINRSGTLRMEYSLGLGYMHTDYTKYAPQKNSNGNWLLVRQKEAKRDYFGPTRAKVSLVWMLNRISKKKGGAQ